MIARASLVRGVVACCMLLTVASRGNAQSAADVRLYGKVTHAAGTPARAGDRVLAYDIDGTKRWIGPALTDDDGTYSFYNLAPGAYVLRVYVDGKPVWNDAVTVRATATRYDIAVGP